MKVFDGKTGFEWFAESAGPDVILTLDVAWAAAAVRIQLRCWAG